MKKELVTGAVKDIGKSILIGVVISVVIAAVLWIVGFLAGGFAVRQGAAMARSGLLIVGALGLFVLAGANLFKQGKTFGLEDHKEEWKKHFSVIGFKVVLGVASVAVLCIAGIFDYFLYY